MAGASFTNTAQLAGVSIATGPRITAAFRSMAMTADSRCFSFLILKYFRFGHQSLQVTEHM